MPTRRGLEKPDPASTRSGSRTAPGPQRLGIVVGNQNHHPHRVLQRPLHHHPGQRARKVRGATTLCYSWLSVALISRAASLGLSPVSRTGTGSAGMTVNSSNFIRLFLLLWFQCLFSDLAETICCPQRCSDAEKTRWYWFMSGFNLSLSVSIRKLSMLCDQG